MPKIVTSRNKGDALIQQGGYQCGLLPPFIHVSTHMSPQDSSLHHDLAPLPCLSFPHSPSHTRHDVMPVALSRDQEGRHLCPFA